MAKKPVFDHQKGSETFSLVDYHVHLTEQFTIDIAVALSQERDVKFGIVEHPGPQFGLETDQDLERYIAHLRNYPVYVGLQPVYRGWSASDTSPSPFLPDPPICRSISADITINCGQKKG